MAAGVRKVDKYAHFEAGSRYNIGKDKLIWEGEIWTN